MAENLNYAALNKHAFVLPKGKLEVKSAYLMVNDTIDVLNIKEQELGNLSKFGSIGDMDGLDLELRYGLTQKDSVFVNYQQWNVDYAGSTLKNSKIDLLNRYNLIDKKHGLFNALSFDIGFIKDSSNPLNIQNDSFLNSLIQKIRPNTNISFNDGSIVSGDTTLTLYDENWNKKYPYLSIANLESTSYYARILLGKKISTKSIIDFYIGYKVTDIKTKIEFYPKDNSFINGLISEFDVPNLNRKEKSLNLGFVYTTQINSYLLEFNYEYNKIYRDNDVSYEDNNHIIDASISKVINKNFLVYVGGKLMLQQFNTDIPYLYNKYTKTQFDKKYGFAKFGMVYSFRGF